VMLYTKIVIKNKQTFMAKLTKNEVIEKLEELGIDYDADAKVADLVALLPQPEDNGEEDAMENPNPKTSGIARVSYRGEVRDYSSERHGKEYKKLAEEFARKQGGTVDLL